MTIKEMLVQSVQKNPNAIALRFKKQDQWRTHTYSELLAHTHQAAELLARLGIKPGDRVAIFRENAPEWPELYFGIIGLAATAVPIDAKLQEQEVAHILRDSGAKALFASVKSYPLLKDVEPHVPDLGHIILMGGQEILPVAARKIKYWDYDELLAKSAEGALSERRAYDRHDPKEDDIASFIYTSGTTGRQKGAMLTHRNFTSNVKSIQEAIHIKASDHFMLVLPLHHAFAFTTNLLTPIGSGAEISFVESLKTVGENIREVSPTLLIGVPLLLEKMYKRIWNGLKENKTAYALYKLGLRAPVIKGIQKKMGGRLRLMVSGGAPCDPDLLVQLTALGLPVLEGYGLTETAPVLTLNPEGAARPGSVGKALPGVELTILDPDGEGVGEIAAKGPNIMKGYYNNPDATDSAFREGWFLTGDLGFISPDGYVTITGRKKSLIVNREGKNIYPEEVEHQIGKSPFISEVLALGYRLEGEKVGEQVGVIIVPNQEQIDAVHKRGNRPLSEKEVTDLLRQEVKRLAVEMAEYKRPRRIKIRWEEFNKTSTGKIKRYLYALGEEDLAES